MSFLQNVMSCVLAELPSESYQLRPDVTVFTKV